MTKKVAVICATPRDRRELAFDHVKGTHSIIFHDIDSDLLDHVVSKGHPLPEHLRPEIINDQILALCKDHEVEGIIATDDYPGSLFASHSAKQLGLPAPDVMSLLLCQHKYHSRRIQQRSVSHATTRYQLIDPAIDRQALRETISFPVFLKPIKSYFSLYAQAAHNYEELVRTLEQPIPFSFDHFHWFAKQHGFEHVPLHHFLAEEYLTGVQCTLEGHSVNGVVTMHGIVDSIMFPGTISFKQFNYPSVLPEQVQHAMAEIAAIIMKEVEFDNGLFNIEFMYDPQSGRISIIEINPRMASQFADIFEKVDGTNTYSILLAIATGNKPMYTYGAGDFACATSYVLRTFENQKVIAMPTEKDVERVRERMPDVRVELFGRAGYTLADELQDGNSYRYGLIHAGAQDAQQLQEKIDECLSMLPFNFELVYH